MCPEHFSLWHVMYFHPVINGDNHIVFFAVWLAEEIKNNNNHRKIKAAGTLKRYNFFSAHKMFSWTQISWARGSCVIQIKNSMLLWHALVALLLQTTVISFIKMAFIRTSYVSALNKETLTWNFTFVTKTQAFSRMCVLLQAEFFFFCFIQSAAVAAGIIS